HRIEHLALVQPADVARLGPLNVISVLRPSEATPLPTRLSGWVTGVGEERTSTAWPAATLAAAKSRIVLGSGWPAASLNPFTAIHAVVNRSDETAPDTTWNGEEALPLKRAIDAFTAGPAYASFDEQRKGSLKPGMLADL